MYFPALFFLSIGVSFLSIVSVLSNVVEGLVLFEILIFQELRWYYFMPLMVGLRLQCKAFKQDIIFQYRPLSSEVNR